MSRPPRLHDVYELRCYQCHCTVELPAASVVNDIGRCDKCDARLVILWREPLQ
jgi:uncharacterized paraquat-inducible protein A